MESTISQIVETCPICTMNNPHIRSLRGPYIRPLQVRGKYAGENWQIDFTVMPRVLGNFRGLWGYGTFSGCVEGFPARSEMAAEVAQALLK